MSVDPNLPGQHGELVTPDFRPTRWWYDWFRRVHARLVVTEATAQAASDAVAAIPDSDPTVIHPSGTINVFGDTDTGYTLEVNQSALALSSRMGPPGWDGEPGEDSYVPGPPGPQGPAGPAGSSGSGSGQTIIIREETHEEAWPIPGPKGDTGAAGGGGSASAGYQIGYARTISTTQASTTASFPVDNTIPQNTEGAAFASLDTAITVAEAASLIRVRITLHLVSHSSAGANFVVALFRDSTANALNSTIGLYSVYANGSTPTPVVLDTVVAAGSAGSTTFKMRYGTLGSGTVYVNTIAGTSYFGGHTAVMEVLEVKQ